MRMGIHAFADRCADFSSGFLEVRRRRPAVGVRMSTPWPFSTGRTISFIVFDVVVIALVGFVLFSGVVI
jgi:hypothetical protein